MAAAPPFKVKAIYEYTSEHDDDLTFPIGQVITVVELEGDDWYVGEYTDAAGSKQEGLFPANFVEKYEPEVPTRPSRPPRAKQEPQQAAQPAPAPAPAHASEPEPAVEEREEEEAPPPPPAASKPAPPPVNVAPTAKAPNEEVKSPPAAPKPAPVEPAEPESASAPAKKAPPPVASKSNAFKDRIAAFNQPAAAPLAPMQPGRKPEPNFIKKPFVAPPPSKNAYVPPVTKQEPVHRPYHRDEDPEVKQREEEDRAAAEAAGFGGEQAPASTGQAEGKEEDAPKPLTLKERMALLQKQQQEQAQRRAEQSTQKKEKKPPTKRPAESSEQVTSPDDEGEGLENTQSTKTRQSVESSRDVPPVPSVSRHPTEPMSPTGPLHEVSSDGHEADQSGAGEMTEDDSGTLGPDKDEIEERSKESLRHPVAPEAEADMGDQQDTTEDDEDEEEDEMDEETRRKEELRARMARLGGGGLPGMGGPFNPFGAPPPAPPKKKASKDSRSANEGAPTSPQPGRAPMVPVPGMGSQRVQSPGSDTTERLRQENDETPQEERDEPELPAAPRRSATMDRAAPPPVPKDSRPVPPPPSQDRPVPPAPSGGVTPRPPAADSRPVPPTPSSAVPMSPGPGSESDDEASMHAKRSSAETPGIEPSLPMRPAAPPVPGSRDVSREVPPRPPQSPQSKRASYFNEPSSTTSEKRSSRAPPPIPGDEPVTSPRPPPPPPPTQAPPSRQHTMDEEEEDERVGSEYDGDYDTDIASSAKHKDALKASPHVREPSLTDNVPVQGETPLGSPPPLPPQASAPRAVPPPPPQAAPKSRPSMDRPPPPVPSQQESTGDDEECDPYRYEGQQSRAAPPPPSGAPRAVPPVPPVQEPASLQEESSADELYAPASPPRKSTERAPPQPPPQAPPTQAPPRASLDAQRTLGAGASRRSMEQSRPSGEFSGQIAQDIALPQETPWWTAERPLPPALQSRNGIDILSECEESSKSKRGGRKEVTKDIYILYMDYSQTVISARYDSQEPGEVHLEQRHEPPPPRMRQDQMEAAWQRFGTKIADAAAQAGNGKKPAAIGDETPASLPFTLIRAHCADALLPVGTRAYGALVYANLANASTMQHDEIRRGDVVTLRNAKFEGHHGAMKTKYRADYGVSHVGVVEEWDGTRRSVRCWEQGREKKGGVRSEKLRLGDLRSGEVRVWRVVGREWVGWDS